MPGTGRTVLEFSAVVIWVLLFAFVIRGLADYTYAKWQNPVTAAIFRIVSHP